MMNMFVYKHLGCIEYKNATHVIHTVLLELCEFVIQDGNTVSGNVALLSFISSL